MRTSSHTEQLIREAVQRALQTHPLLEEPEVQDPFIDLLDLRVDREGKLFYQAIIQNVIQNGSYSISEDDYKLIHHFDWFYQQLTDDQSRIVFDWYIQIMVARILTQSLKEAETLYPYSFLEGSMAKTIKMFIRAAKNSEKNRFIIDGYDIRTTAPALMETWTCRTYALSGICEVQPGDIVVDAGAYKGETALWFAKELQHQGHVYSIEMVPEFCDVIKENIARNHLENVITADNYALWSHETILPISINDSLSLCNMTGAQKAEAITIDSLVKKHQISRLDFIKMDLESAEIEALIGARDTIKRFHPKLAVCVYHRLSHLYEVGEFIKELDESYQFYLSHKTFGPMNTILFCVPAKR